MTNDPYAIMLAPTIATLIYFIPSTYLYGKTLGKKLMGLEVVRMSGEPRSFWRLLMRETVGKWVGMLCLGLGYIWFRFQKDRRAWHDLMTDSIVVDIR